MADSTIKSRLLRRVDNLEEYYPLSSLSSLEVGGVADYFTRANSSIDLVSAIKGAMDVEIPYLVVSFAEGVLFSDGGFPGLIIQNNSRNIAFFPEKSQVVVDSGVPISTILSQSVSLNMGGLTGYFGRKGSIGAAIYSGERSIDGQQIASMVKTITVLMPPARIDKDAVISKQTGSWLEASGFEEGSKLSRKKASSDLNVNQPIILSCVLQLTSVRRDELENRIINTAKRTGEGKGFGPIFHCLPDSDLTSVLKKAGANRLGMKSVFPDRYNPNYLCRGKGPLSSKDILSLVENMESIVYEKFSIKLVRTFECVGVW